MIVHRNFIGLLILVLVPVINAGGARRSLKSPLKTNKSMSINGTTKIDSVQMVKVLVNSAHSSQKILQERLEKIGAGAKTNIEEFASTLELLVRESIPASHLAEILKTSRSRAMLKSMHDGLINMLASIKDMGYFCEVMQVIGDYYGWLWIEHSLTGDKIPVTWKPAQLVFARVAAAVNLEDMETLLDIADIMGKIPPGSVKSDMYESYKRALVMNQASLTQADHFWEIIGKMTVRSPLKEIITGDLKSKLTVGHIEYALTQSPEFLGDTLALLRTKGGSELEKQVFTQLGLSSKFKHTPTIPKPVTSTTKLSQRVQHDLSGIQKPRVLYTKIRNLLEGMTLDPDKLLPIIKESKLNDCTKTISIMFLATLISDSAAIRESYDAACDSFRHGKCPVWQVAEALEYILLEIPIVEEEEDVFDAILHSRLLASHKLRNYVKTNNNSCPNLYELVID
ncbi:hypothetical protein PSACC_01291 [Paramicrosporidium saccamoebae]|uniref:Uncharacterized protein n=1 Tax=Paramicrosporidium saccamoebae TaxID=1246581 RepID=A0A2H9TMC1_9FUNG|nr:hypothetical protein PSACC_01291 [Paramicrosporidium saccamoebae]